ncbi:hypothetical protein KL86DYS2_10366 [uncultured Dysgonomonas sp.]|uniref:Uncharacterized protein n=1 Tax=uncultured Dysgonomonas sp. TaxID=206096 RepID=A0A212IZ32_9BACT|nr:hypothetical protein KL86DYS2_10366 [uncultured Dysgonomonas sp.]
MSVGLFIYNHKEKKVKGQYIQNTVTFVSFLVQSALAIMIDGLSLIS